MTYDHLLHNVKPRKSRVPTNDDLRNWSPTGNPDRPKPPQPEAHFVCVADVERREIQWLWRDRIPLGKLTLICGDPGNGKSHVTTDMAARVSTDVGCWPDRTEVEHPGSVILFSAEDDASDTIRPRLERAGADLTKVYVLESVKVFDPRLQEMRHSAFCLGEHVPLLEKMVEEIGDVRLIVIDPISSYTGKVDSHKNAEVRAMLMELVKLAERLGIAVVVVTHLSKGSGGKAVYRSTGSLAFAAAARVVWMLARDFDNADRRLLLPVKCNIAAEQSGLAFCIQSDAGGSFVSWESDPVAMTGDAYLAEEINRQQGRAKDSDTSALAKAQDFIKDQLKDGPLLSNELAAACKANDISPATLRRAKEQLGCKVAKQKKTGKWMTLLPDQALPEPAEAEQNAHTPTPQQDERLEHVEQDAPLIGEQDAQGVQDAQGNHIGQAEHVASEVDHLNSDGTRKPRRTSKAKKRQRKD